MTRVDFVVLLRIPEPQRETSFPRVDGDKGRSNATENMSQLFARWSRFDSV